MATGNQCWFLPGPWRVLRQGVVQDLLLAGGRSLYTAIKKGIAFADVNQEKKKSYGGYGGLINLAEDLKNALQNPVFKNVARRAPWEM